MHTFLKIRLYIDNSYINILKNFKFAVFGHFFLFISINLKTVGKCSLLTVISIKDIRFAVENHPQKSYLNIDLVEFRFYVRFADFGAFFFVYLNYYENCWEMFTFKGYKHQGDSVCSRKPPSNDLVEFRFYVRFDVFGHFFFSFMSIIMKTVGKCSLLKIISIKDIRFAVENHPQKSYLNIDLVGFRFY
ncbi:hypothetical protein AGLY_017921, partial [Aphis glycines]